MTDLLVKAAGPGRIRGIGLELWTRARAAGSGGGWALRTGLREARALHSAERRLVQEALYGLIRQERALAAVLGEDPLRWWLGWLVTHGLAAEVAAGEAPGPWDQLPARLAAVGEGKPAAERLAVRHSVPEGLAERLVDQVGADEAERFLIASDRRAPVDLRPNPRWCTVDALAARLLAEGVTTARVGDGLRVEGRAALEGLPAWRDGWFEVQDLGSQRVAALVPAGVRVLDVCAGAGGKSLAFAGVGCEVTALDVRRSALVELEKRARRAGARIRTRQIPEDRLPDDVPTAPWVVVDAPCTGTGTLRRHPEVRWWWSPEELARLQSVQQRLIREAADRVEPGGRLLYATCSVLVDEDEAVARSLEGWTVERELRTWPHVDDGDGFYAAVLARRDR